MTTADRVARIRFLARHLDELEAQAQALGNQITEAAQELEALAGASVQAPKPSTAAGASGESGLAPGTERAERQSKAATALEAISKNNKLTYAELSVLLYGDDTDDNKSKARSVIYFLTKKANKLRGGPGAWEITRDG